MCAMRSLPISSDLNGKAVDLHAHYAADWIETGGVRVNLVSSVDGAATASGLSRGLQTPGDKAVFTALRDLADVVLVGAATASIEGYRPANPSEDRRAVRLGYGLSAVPAIAVMSSSLDLDPTAALFTEASADAPTVIVTGSAAPVGRRNDIIDLAASGAAVQLLEVPADPQGGANFMAAIQHLRELGHRRILCEGGPRLFAAGAGSGGVDELCLTLSPLLVGPGGPRIVNGPPWADAMTTRLSLIGLLTEDDALFCRYRLNR
jgi:riboflavin biosynthesis pyrimidine reductase